MQDEVGDAYVTEEAEILQQIIRSRTPARSAERLHHAVAVTELTRRRAQLECEKGIARFPFQAVNARYAEGPKKLRTTAGEHELKKRMFLSFNVSRELFAVGLTPAIERAMEGLVVKIANQFPEFDPQIGAAWAIEEKKPQIGSQIVTVSLPKSFR